LLVVQVIVAASSAPIVSVKAEITGGVGSMVVKLAGELDADGELAPSPEASTEVARKKYVVAAWSPLTATLWLVTNVGSETFELNIVADTPYSIRELAGLAVFQVIVTVFTPGVAVTAVITGAVVSDAMNAAAGAVGEGDVATLPSTSVEDTR
jgi:hypothetical protein